MNRPILRLSIFLALALQAAGCRGPHEPQADLPGPDTGIPARIDAYVRPLADAGELSGTLLVAEGGRVVYERAFGMASYELGVSNTPGTPHGVASVTKLLTAILALRLLDEGLFSLDTRATTFLPDFPGGSEITVGHLLRHRSGIPHRVTDDSDVSTPRTAADMTELAGARELLFPPGTDRAYSSAGYSVLARVLELATNRDYAQLLSTEIFAPAGAEHSFTANGLTLINGRSEDYLRGGLGPVPAPPADLSFLVGAGSVFSTPRDLYAIMRTVDEGGYGELVQVELLGEERTVAWNGQTFGYRAWVDYDGAAGRAVIWAGNLHTGAPDLLRSNIPRILAGEPVGVPRVPLTAGIVLSPESMVELAGAYRFRADDPGSEEILRFSPDGRQGALGSSWMLVPVAPDRFLSTTDYGMVTVLRAPDGRVRSMEWRKGDDSFVLSRVPAP